MFIDVYWFLIFFDGVLFLDIMDVLDRWIVIVTASKNDAWHALIPDYFYCTTTQNRAGASLVLSMIFDPTKIWNTKLHCVCEIEFIIVYPLPLFWVV